MKIPFQLTAAVDLETRRAQMLSAIARDLPRLEQVPINEKAVLHVACYGPSLRDTWKDLGRPLMAMSAATQWLVKRGVVPDYHVAMDPRPNQANDLTPPVAGVNYLISSVCHPKCFDNLQGAKVTLWHAISSNEESDIEWLSQHDPGTLLVSTGSHIGLGALQVAGLLGFRHFEIHGMDGSFADDGARHAGQHTGKAQAADQVWQAGNHPYRTSKIMANGVAETINALRVYPIFCVFHGKGLTQALVRESGILTACCADEVEKAKWVRSSTARFVDIPPLHRKEVHCWSACEAFGCANLRPEWLDELQGAFADAEKRRFRAHFNTGSISLEAGLQLRALCDWKKPEVIIEIGTFIGKSTHALKAQRCIYTCDKDNDCLLGSDSIRVHPKQTSTAMLRQLQEDNVQADLFFIDGRLKDDDIPLLRIVSKPDAVYALDDFYPGGKGEANVQKLSPLLNGYGFVEPYKAFHGRSTLALLIPTK